MGILGCTVGVIKKQLGIGKVGSIPIKVLKSFNKLKYIFKKKSQQ